MKLIFNFNKNNRHLNETKELILNIKSDFSGHRKINRNFFQNS